MKLVVVTQWVRKARQNILYTSAEINRLTLGKHLCNFPDGASTALMYG
jgi:hypothetical protein